MSLSEDDLSTFKNRVVGSRIAENSYQMYEIWIRRFEMWRSGEEPTLGDLYDFDNLLADESVTDYPWKNDTGRPAPNEYAYRSRRQAISAVKLWVRLNYNVTIEDEVQYIVSGEPDPFDPPYLSHDDVQSVIDNAAEDCNNPDCRAMLTLTYDGILRAAEACDVRREDVDLDEGTLYVRVVKGGDPVTITLNDHTVSVLREHIEENSPSKMLFTNTYGNGWKPSSWSSHFRRNHHEVGAHSFGRHTPILHRLTDPEEFPDVDEEQDVFGQVYRRARHEHPSMTNKYARMVGVDVPDWAEQ